MRRQKQLSFEEGAVDEAIKQTKTTVQAILVNLKENEIQMSQFTISQNHRPFWWALGPMLATMNQSQNSLGLIQKNISSQMRVLEFHYEKLLRGRNQIQNHGTKSIKENAQKCSDDCLENDDNPSESFDIWTRPEKNSESNSGSENEERNGREEIEIKYVEFEEFNIEEERFFDIFCLFVSKNDFDILKCFAYSRFHELNMMHQKLKTNILKTIQITGGQQELIMTVSWFMSNLVISKLKILKDYETCFKEIKAIISYHLSDIINVTIKGINRGHLVYSQFLTDSLKAVFCEVFRKVVLSVDHQIFRNYQTATDTVFENFKVNMIEYMEKFVKGYSEIILYGFIERELKKIFNEYTKRVFKGSMEQFSPEVEELKKYRIDEFFYPKNNE